jgi:uncharacterized protein (DUF58 family)
MHELVNHPVWETNSLGSAKDEKLTLIQAMAALRRVTRPGSLVVVISDFIGFSRAAQAYLAGIAKHNEVLAIFISDPLEHELPPPGRYRLVSNDAELTIDTYARTARLDYQQAFEQRHHGLEKFCQRYGIHLMAMSTQDDPVACMQAALGKRAH